MIAPVREIRHDGGVIAEVAVLEFVDDGLLLVVDLEEHEKKFDSGAERSLRLVKVSKVLVDIQFIVEGGTGSLVKTLEELQHVGDNIVL